MGTFESMRWDGLLGWVGGVTRGIERSGAEGARGRGERMGKWGSSKY